jgi:predicted phage tail protein
MSEIYGEGKGGGGGHTPIEQPDTLRTYQTALVLAGLSEGPIAAVNEIFFDDTGISTYANCGYEIRYGDSTQNVIPGFSKVASTITVGTVLTQNTPVSRDVTSSAIDEVVIALQCDALSKMEDDGDIVGYKVNFRIETTPNSASLGGAVWTTYSNVSIGPGKSANAPVVRTFAVDKPSTATGIWAVRVTRTTPNDGSVKVVSPSRWNTITERQHHKMSYDNTALAGIHSDAQATGGTIPRTSFDVSGLKIKIPSNYDPIAKTHTGSWDGLFKAGVHFTSNPAWVVYDLLTNTRYGLGLDPNTIDKYSFYNASVYNDGQLTYVNSSGVSTTSSRFTFNGVIQSYEDGYSLIQSVASCMRAQIIDMGGMVTLLQDRPFTGTPIVFTNNNVIDGHFDYTSSSLQERHTQVNITWNDPTDRYLQKIVTCPFTSDTTYNADIAKYPYNSLDLAAIGCTDEGQAYRLGKWQLDTDLKTTNMVSFKVGLQNLFMYPGDVIAIMDEYWNGVQQSARIVSSTLTSITLDRAITIPTGTTTLTFLLADGKTYTTVTATNAAGSITTFTFSALSSLPFVNTSVIVSTPSVTHQLYRVAKITLTQGDDGVFGEVVGTQYDPNKYTRIDTVGTVPPTLFAPTSIYSVAAPTSASAKIIGIVDTKKQTVSNTLELIWVAGDTQPVTFEVSYNYENNNPIIVKDLPNPALSIPNAKDGFYSFKIWAVNKDKVKSNVLLFSATLGASSAPGAPAPMITGSSSLLAPTNLQVSTGGLAFTTKDLNITFTNPNIDGPGKNTFQDFILEVWNASNTTLLKSVVIPKITGQNTNTLYSFQWTNADNANANSGIPSRSIPIRIYARDTVNGLSTVATATFSNAVPAAVSCTIDSSSNGAFVRITPSGDADVAGYIVWRSTTSGFTALDSTTQVYDGPDTSVALFSNPGTTYYYKCAAYDVFGKTGLNVSGQVASSTASQTAGPVNYSFSGLVFTPNSPSANSVAWTAGTAVVQANGASNTYSIAAGSAAWTSGTKTYIYYVKATTSLQSTTNFGAAMGVDNIVVAVYSGGTDIQVGNGKPIIDGSTLIAGSVGANQIVAGYVDTAVLNSNTAFIKDVNIRDTISSTNYNGTSNGWRLDKAGNITTFGSLVVKDTNGATVLDTSGVTWGRVVGAGRPADNATVNNGAFANLSGPITPSNITSYISNLAVGSLQIDGNAVVIPVGMSFGKTRFQAGSGAVTMAVANANKNAATGGGWITLTSASIDMTIAGATNNQSQVIISISVFQYKNTGGSAATGWNSSCEGIRIIDETNTIIGPVMEGEVNVGISVSDGNNSMTGSFDNMTNVNFIAKQAATGVKTYRLQAQAVNTVSAEAGRYDLYFRGAMVLMGAKKNG